jgi:phage shock protein A
MTVAELESRIAALEQKVATLQEQLERAQVQAGIKRGLDDFDRGDYKTLRQFDNEFRAKHNIPRR